MNIRAKFTVVALFSVFAFASNPAKADVLGFSGTLPSLGAVTTEVGQDRRRRRDAYLRNAVSAPRVTRTRQSPTVTVHQIVETAAMETVTVVATRLPRWKRSLWSRRAAAAGDRNARAGQHAHAAVSRTPCQAATRRGLRGGLVQ